MKLADVLQRAYLWLVGAQIEDAHLESEVLLMNALQKNCAWIIAHANEELPDDSLGCFEELLRRRLAHEPTAYIVGHRDFYGLEFMVDRRVMIPRPETELLVELALKFVRAQRASAPLLADVATGSGAVAVALAKNLPESIVYATEIDGDALVVAEANCRRHGVSDRVRLLQGDLLSPLPERVQVIVANPPYVKSGDIPGLAPEIRLREPLQALDGGPDGLRVIRPLIEQAPACLLANGAMFLELGPDQAGPALEIAAAVFPIAHVRIEPDLAGLPRALCVYT